MAVTYDTTFEKGSGGTTSPFSFVSNAGTVSGSVGSNTNRVLIAYSETPNSSTVTGVTWAGVSMSSIGSIVSNSRTLALWGLIAPAIGAQTLSLTFTGTTGEVVLGAVSLYNADQSTGWRNFASSTSTSISPSLTITTASGDIAVAAMQENNAISDTTVLGTRVWQDDSFSFVQNQYYSSASGTSTTISAALGSSVLWGMVGVDVLSPATGTAYTLSSSAGAYSVTGEAATLSQGFGTSYTLLGASGTYDYTGAFSSSAIQIDLDTGTYTVTGVDAGLLIPGGFTLIGNVGDYSLSGQNSTLSVSSAVLQAVTGIYSVTGQGVALFFSGSGGSGGVNVEKLIGLTLMKLGAGM